MDGDGSDGVVMEVNGDDRDWWVVMVRSLLISGSELMMGVIGVMSNWLVIGGNGYNMWEEGNYCSRWQSEWWLNVGQLQGLDKS